MRKLTLSGFALVLVFAVSGCGDSHDSLAKDTVKTMNDITEVADTIKDKKSAEEAKPKLEKLAEKLKDLKKRSDKLGKISKDKEEALNKKYDIKAVGTKAGFAMGKAMLVPGGADAVKPVMDAFKTMK